MASNLKTELKKIKKILELFHIPDIERSPYELERNKEELAGVQRRAMDTTKAKATLEEQAGTTE